MDASTDAHPCAVHWDGCQRDAHLPVTVGQCIDFSTPGKPDSVAKLDVHRVWPGAVWAARRHANLDLFALCHKIIGRSERSLQRRQSRRSTPS